MARAFLIMASVLGFVALVTPLVEAISAPTTGSFAYDIYDIAVNDILKGPIGFVAGAAAIVLGAVAAIRAQIMAAVPAILGGAALLKADAITASLGLLI